MSTGTGTGTGTKTSATTVSTSPQGRNQKRAKRYHGAPTGLLTVRIDAAHPDRSVRLVDTLLIDPQLVLTAPIENSFSSATSNDQSYMSQIHHQIGEGSIYTDLNADSELSASQYNIVDAIHKFSYDMAGQIVADYEVNGTQRVTKHFNGRLSLVTKPKFVHKVACQIKEPLMKHFFSKDSDGSNKYLHDSSGKKVTKVDLKVRLQNTVIIDEFYYDWTVPEINPIVIAINIAQDLKVHASKSKVTLPDETPGFLAAEITRQLNENDRIDMMVNVEKQETPEVETKKQSELLRSVDTKEVFAAEYKVLTECHP